LSRSGWTPRACSFSICTKPRALQPSEHLDDWLGEYSERSHSGKYCYGRTPLQTFLDSIWNLGDEAAPDVRDLAGFGRGVLADGSRAASRALLAP